MHSSVSCPGTRLWRAALSHAGPGRRFHYWPEEKMNKSIVGLVAAATLAASIVTVPSQADARYWHGRGWGVGAGILGGLAAGALIGGYGYRGYPGYYAYGPEPYYDSYGPGPYYAYGCHSRRVWTPYGWRWRRYC
jgi:hypothetical protein